MSQTPLTDAYLASRCKGENKLSWVEFARGLEEKLTQRLDLSGYINSAAINAADMPHTVVDKLQRAINQETDR